MTQETNEILRNEITRLHKACRNYQVEIAKLKAQSIQFNFMAYTKLDLIEFCYGKNARVDVAIPIEIARKIKAFAGDYHHFWYVMDYTGDNLPFGKLVNLKEKFFSVVANQLTMLKV